MSMNKHKMSFRAVDKGSAPLPKYKFCHAESYAKSVSGWFPAISRLTTSAKSLPLRNCRLTIYKHLGVGLLLTTGLVLKG